MSKFEVGQSAFLKKTVLKEDVIKFSEVSLDTNPVHLSEEYAAQTFFKKPIAHGMLSASVVSAALGTKLPGHGAIYLSQQLQFLKPVYIGETITAHVQITAIESKTNKQGGLDQFITLETWVENSESTKVLTGEAKALVRTSAA